MKHLLLFLSLSFCNVAFVQVVGERKTPELTQLISKIEQHKCVLLFYDDHFATPETKQQAEDIKPLSELDFHTLDSLFYTEKKEIKIQLFFVMCTKFRSEITKKHLAALDDKQKIKVCDGNRAADVSLKDIATVLYENSVERKEKIQSPEALELFNRANELLYEGPVDFAKIVSLLNEADLLEPKNPIILSERGDAKFNSKLDIDGAFLDFNNAILYSLDEKSREIRYYNLGLSFMGFGDITAACENWHKAGQLGQGYIKQYCSQPVDTIIHTNPDSSLVLSLKLDQPTARITSSHNSPAMSSCNAHLSIRNVGLDQLTIVDNNLDYGLENSGSSIYLEAIAEDGRKFRFFTETEYASYGTKGDKKLGIGDEYSKNIDLTALHQFPYAGKYKVRIAVRPSKNLKGLKQTYYSNWQTLVIVKDYQIEDEGY